jgi:FixJ family two-component response regulator
MRDNDALVESVHVAVVDDDDSIRVAIKTLLESLGLCVQAYASAGAFLDSSLSQNFDCLILDVRMPVLGGLELQRRLAVANRRIPVVFITAHYSEEERIKAMEAGAADFLSKPFSERQLLSAIRLALQQLR